MLAQAASADPSHSEATPGRHALRLLGLSCVTFLLVYNISPANHEAFTTDRVGVALLLAASCLLGWFRRSLPDWQTFLIFLPLPFALMQSGMSLDSEQFSR